MKHAIRLFYDPALQMRNFAGNNLPNILLTCSAAALFAADKKM